MDILDQLVNESTTQTYLQGESSLSKVYQMQLQPQNPTQASRIEGFPDVIWESPNWHDCGSDISIFGPAQISGDGSDYSMSKGVTEDDRLRSIERSLNDGYDILIPQCYTNPDVERDALNIGNAIEGGIIPGDSPVNFRPSFLNPTSYTSLKGARCYFRCAYPNCTVRRQREASSDMEGIVLIIYFGKHNHLPLQGHTLNTRRKKREVYITESQS
ncbi:hypothetical protein KP509_13G048500 [Ceratopteris richardii]|uniref:WRKY domain-containing protein n=1 Tax=Ceratopteris richardii TaxID=49495 RepID=A0A8T2TFF0_CERRI|nr:hypothetical protein KP509_13G048500 [Ceratopteris richardii]